jgi:DNA-directed RNA polymerase subunit M/transcription elongation factor TFIIS
MTEIKMELEAILSKYFGKHKNIDYILKKTNGSEQRLKIYELLCIINNPNSENRDYSEEGGDEEKKMLENMSKAISYLKKNKLLWSHDSFSKEQKKIEEENDFMVCPYEISEGVLTCKKCKCRKIFSYTKQTRSMDEPTTVFAFCSECGFKWCEGS